MDLELSTHHASFVLFWDPSVGGIYGELVFMKCHLGGKKPHRHDYGGTFRPAAGSGASSQVSAACLVLNLCFSLRGDSILSSCILSSCVLSLSNPVFLSALQAQCNFNPSESEQKRSAACLTLHVRALISWELPIFLLEWQENGPFELPSSAVKGPFQVTPVPQPSLHALGG